MQSKLMPGLRIRVKVYQNDIGVLKGHWSYFLRVGEDNPGMTFHSDYLWEHKSDALDAAKEKAKLVMGVVKDIEPSTLWSINSWLDSTPEPKDE